MATGTGVSVRWEGRTADDLRRELGVPTVDLHAEVDSTLDVAHALADAGAPSGTVVLAECQRAGRGRLGRSWSSWPGHGVWVTVVERDVSREALEVISLRVGLLLAEALDSLAHDRVRVKWPNDLVLRGGGKVAGILTEARWSGGALGWVAVGIGINVLAPSDVTAAAGLAGADRRHVLAAAVRAVRAAAHAPGSLTTEELRRFAERDALRGRDVASPLRGRAAGIDATGALLVERAGGAGVERCRTGTIQLAEDDS